MTKSSILDQGALGVGLLSAGGAIRVSSTTSPGGTSTTGGASASSGAVVSLGQPCSGVGKLACAGVLQTTSLVCGASGIWEVNRPPVNILLGVNTACN